MGDTRGKYRDIHQGYCNRWSFFVGGKMTEQITMFETQADPKGWLPAGMVRRKDPDTCREAAQRVMESGQAQAHRDIILSALRRREMTGKEIAACTILDFPQVMRRIHELRKLGQVEPVNTLLRKTEYLNGIPVLKPVQEKRDGAGVWRVK